MTEDSELPAKRTHTLSISGDARVETAVAGDQHTHIHAASPPLPSLHQLRAPVADFVGRTGEIAQLITTLRQAAEQGGVAAICGVQAMGGMGKTELAYKVAQQLKDTYPDAQIVLDLRGATSDPLTPTQVLQRVITAFDANRELPVDVAVLKAQYRSLLHGRRVLILADDARDAAQVECLVPPPGCALLMTSRQRFTLKHGIHRVISLDGLSAQEAITLLLSLAPTLTDDQSRQIAQLCGYLPLALRIIGGALVKGRIPFARFLVRLQDERTRLGTMQDVKSNLDVEASLRLSYELLSPSLQELLCQVAVFPASFDVTAAEGVLHIDNDVDLLALLGELQDYHLLNYDPVQNRYDQHSLVRLFAGQQAAATMVGRGQVVPWWRKWLLWYPRCPQWRTLLEKTQERHARHYLTVAEDAERLYLKGGDNMLVGLALFDAERMHIDTGWKWARDRVGDLATGQLVLEYGDATAYVGALRYAVRTERIPQWEAVLSVAQQVGNRFAECGALGNLGNAYANMKDVATAIRYYEQALIITRELGVKQREGISLGNLGLAHADKEEVLTAIGYYEQALAIMREIEDKREEAGILGNLGNAYRKLGNVQKAIACYEQHLVIARDIGDRRGEAAALGNLGNAYRKLWDRLKAIDYYQQSLVITQALGDRIGEAQSCWNFGALYVEQGQIVEGTALMQRWVDYLMAIEDPDAEKHAAYVAELRARLRVGNG